MANSEAQKNIRVTASQRDSTYHLQIFNVNNAFSSNIKEMKNVTVNLDLIFEF